MINKLFGSIIFISCLFALFLSLSGVDHSVWFGNEFRAFIVATNRELQSYKITIPNIPYIDIKFLSWSDSVSSNIIVILNNFFMFFGSVLNGITTILNFVILAINTIIELLEFAFILIKNFITLRDSVVDLSA